MKSSGIHRVHQIANTGDAQRRLKPFLIAASTHSNRSFEASFELPAQLRELRAYGGRIDHLQLVLAPPDTTNEASEELESAIVEALSQCPLFSSLSVRYVGNAPPQCLDYLCSLLSSRNRTIDTLELDFQGDATSECLKGMTHLLLCPFTQLICKGSLAASAVLRSCAQHMDPPTFKVQNLEIEFTASHNQQLIDDLARQSKANVSIKLRLSEDSDADPFIESLLAAGASPELQLTVQTPQGDTIRFGDRIDCLRRMHLDDRVHRFMPNGKPHHVELLKHCRTIEVGGAQLFAWACSVMPVEDDEVPEVPAKLTAYLRALYNMRVKHTITCVLPQDTQALNSIEKALIQSLRVEFDCFDINDPVLQAAGAALQSLTRMTTCSVHGDAATIQFGAWLCNQLRQLPTIKSLHLDFDGAEVTQVNRDVALLLARSTLNTLTCTGLMAASLVMEALAAIRNMGSQPPKLSVLTLRLQPEHESKLGHWLHGVRWRHLRLHVHFCADHVADALNDWVLEELQKKQPCFSLREIQLSSHSYQSSSTNPLALAMTKRVIEWVMQGMPLGGKAVHQQAKGIDQNAIVRAFANSIGNGINDIPMTAISAEQRARMMAAVRFLLDPLAQHLTPQLKKNDLMALSATSHLSRAHIGNLALLQREAAILWLQSQTMVQGNSVQRERMILQELFGEKVTRKVLKSAGH